jgi:hypothetical protein
LLLFSEAACGHRFREAAVAVRDALRGEQRVWLQDERQAALPASLQAWVQVLLRGASVPDVPEAWSRAWLPVVPRGGSEAVPEVWLRVCLPAVLLAEFPDAQRGGFPVEPSAVRPLASVEAGLRAVPDESPAVLDFPA